ncbi:MAG: ABC transporter ATP-binding protein [Clostridia bacterium]
MIKGLLFFIKFSWHEKKSYIILNAINQLLIGLLPIVIIAVPKYIIDELMGQQQMVDIVVYVTMLLVAIFINSWGVSHINLMIFNQRCYLSSRFSKFMHEKLANTDFCNLEKPDYFEMKEKANKFLYGDWHGFSYVLESAFTIVGKVFTLIGIIAIISAMNVFIVSAFLLMVLASAFIDSKAKRKSHQLSMDAVKVERRWNYFTRILEDVSYSKEIRMNNISKWLIDSEMDYSYRAIDFYKKRNKYFSLSSLFSSVSGLIQNAIAYAYLIYRVIVNTISIGEFTMYLNAVATFSGAIRDVLSSLVDIKVYGLYYEALDKYVNIPETLRDNKRIPLPIKNNNSFVISFQNVSFKYPGQDTYAIKNLNFEIKSGTKLSIVGENGAGKTTFIKLLCRLYDPTEGEILCNDINIKDIDYDEYMSMFSAVFQDFKLFAFSIKDNIVFNDKNNISREMISKLLHEVGIDEKVKTLPNGIDTSVYKEFDENGFEPSGGEGQKIAIARAIARDSKVIILDEPLSALDPKAEHEIFQQFGSMIGDKTAIYISHRLSSCRLCDYIVVFESGNIIEYGTHDELIAQNRKYAELFNLQAQRYMDKK